MKFCERCGSYIERTTGGLKCPKCGNEIHTEEIEVKRERRPPLEPIFFINNKGDEAPKVNFPCPHCGNKKAYRLVYSSQGEHAGVKHDRIVERLRCTKCNHTWTKS